MSKRIPAYPCSEENCGELFPKCGSSSAYAYHKCRCTACREGNRIRHAEYVAANRDKIRQYKRELYAATQAHPRPKKVYPTEPHSFGPCSPDNCGQWVDRCGTHSSYGKIKCRCDKCMAAKRDYEATRRVARRQHFREKARRYRAENPDAIYKWREANPDAYRKITHRACVNRRIRERSAYIEDVNPTVVFDRDGWVCQRCGITCPKHVSRQAKNAATVDHIVALANGGVHSYENVQTLCRSCNSKKAHRELWPAEGGETVAATGMA